jgi:hypothetical protein
MPYHQNNEPAVLLAAHRVTLSAHAYGLIATLMTPWLRSPNSAYASPMCPRENEWVSMGVKSIRFVRTSSIKRRMRSLPPGHNVVTTRWSPRPAAKASYGSSSLPEVDAQARKRPARSQAAQRALEGLLRTERLDCNVGTAAGQALDFGQDVLLPIVEHDIGSHHPGEAEPRFISVDTDDERRTHELRANGRAQADRTLSEDHYGVADSDATRFGARDAR